MSVTAKNKAVEYALNKPYESAANWLYTHLIAEFFAEYGKDLPSDLKRAMLSDIAAFYDMYETARPEDDMRAFCDVLKTLYRIYPEQTLKHMRAAYAVSLIYDVPPPPGWPDCKMPSNPAAVSQPQELFWHFVENPSVFVFSLDALSVGELVWTMGVAGPLSELKGLLKPNTLPSVLEKAKQAVKTDNSRLKNKKFLPWDESERDFTPENIKKYGASDNEKMYYAWRFANANGIPCLYFCEEAGGILEIWFAYMSKPGAWKYDIERSPGAKKLFGRPLNPQTWKPADMYDMAMLGRRCCLAADGVVSNTFLRCSQILYNGGSYSDAAVLAEKSKKANPDNWRAYLAYIYAKARAGSGPDELDALWKDACGSFRKYPDVEVGLLKLYRDNLILRKKYSEADRLFFTEMRGILRVDPGFALEVYARELNGLFSRLEDKTEIFPVYLDILRRCSPSKCLGKITVPLAAKFANAGDMRSALKTVSMYENTNGSNDTTEKLRQRYSPGGGSKELE